MMTFVVVVVVVERIYMNFVHFIDSSQSTIQFEISFFILINAIILI